MNIDFYILETASRQKAWFFACQLLEKLYLEQQKTVFVHTQSREEAESLDALLWTYRDDSFIPHTLSGSSEAPIQIGYDDNHASNQSVLVNLNQGIPGFYSQFEHVIEIVFSDPVVQQLARERYKQYRDQGHNINTIKI